MVDVVENNEVEESNQPRLSVVRSESAVPRLIEIIKSQNIVDILDDEKLSQVAIQIKENFDQDLDSMQEWINLVEKGQELMKQDFSARSLPWENAANFKSPIILNAILNFGDTASQELLRKPEVVKGMVIGKDPDSGKDAQAQRASTFMNFQLNVQMTEWRVEHDKLLYTLPSTGCMFKKTFFDAQLGRNISDVIFYPNFVVNQSNTTVEDANCFTQILQFTENEVVEKKRSGQWADVDFIIDDSNMEGQPEENQDRFLEQHGWFDLDDDGYKEPYVVTMHEGSRQIVKIVPRFMPNDVNIRIGEDSIDLAGLMLLMQNAPSADDEIFEDAQVISISPINLITKYDFLPDPSGEFLGIGYPHLLAGVTQAINTTTNHLLDAGTLSNMPGGYLAKGVRKRLGEERFRPGEWKSTNVPARDFQSAFWPVPFKEPSATLFQLNEKMQNEAERTSASADFSKVLANNAPATTTLALLQKETQATTSIIRRIYLAMSEEFKKMARLNQRFVDPNLYEIVLDDPEANFKTDFDFSMINFVPVANPEMSTRIERVKSGEVQMGFLPQITEAGGQSQVVISNFLDALGVENIEAVFPQPQPNQIDQQIEEQRRANDIQEFQTGLFDRELKVREAELQRKFAETFSKAAETRANIVKISSEALLNLEKAETEDAKNQLEVYTTELDTLVRVMDNLRGAANENNQSATG